MDERGGWRGEDGRTEEGKLERDNPRVEGINSHLKLFSPILLRWL